VNNRRQRQSTTRSPEALDRDETRLLIACGQQDAVSGHRNSAPGESFGQLAAHWFHAGHVGVVRLAALEGFGDRVPQSRGDVENWVLAR
jgi:hypothetical protein